jgi:hypothetical protein
MHTERSESSLKSSRPIYPTSTCGTSYENGLSHVIYTANFSVMAVSFLLKQQSGAVFPAYQKDTVLGHTANVLKVYSTIFN